MNRVLTSRAVQAVMMAISLFAIALFIWVLAEGKVSWQMGLALFFASVISYSIFFAMTCYLVASGVTQLFNREADQEECSNPGCLCNNHLKPMVFDIEEETWVSHPCDDGSCSCIEHTDREKFVGGRWVVEA